LTDTDSQLLAKPPAVSEHFEIDGISFANSIAHPVLGHHWRDFHDRLVWSKDIPDMRGPEEGRNVFLLTYGFLRANHRIIAIPLARTAAQRVWDAFMRQMAPQYRDAWRIKAALYDIDRH
jgi:hypothetical protein